MRRKFGAKTSSKWRAGGAAAAAAGGGLQMSARQEGEREAIDHDVAIQGKSISV